MPRYVKKHPVTVKEALDQGLISRYYSKGWKRYFYASLNKQDFVTGDAALSFYFANKKQQEVESDQSAFESVRESFPDCFVASRDGDYVNYWTGTEEGWQNDTIRPFRQQLFTIEETCGFGLIWIKPEYLQLLKADAPAIATAS